MVSNGGNANVANARVAFSALNVAMRQHAQSIRCLTLAMFAIMKNDPEKAVSELVEISGRLAEATEYLDEMIKASEDMVDAD